MMKKLLALILASAMALSMVACSSAPAEEPNTEPETPEVVTPADPELLMATTTSTDNTGLLDYLEPYFEEATGYDISWTAVGTGAAIQMGVDGEVDVILVHSKASEEEFVANGNGVERFQVMYNDYVIVGPTGGAVAYTNDIDAALTQIKDEGLTFVSRGDDSGTHKAELKLWKALDVDVATLGDAYVSAGAGMGDTLVMADEMDAYCLTDRGTWLAKKANFPEMEIVVEGSAGLLNQYGVIAVNPEVYPDTNIDGANAYIEWLCSEETQSLIADFGVEEYGEPLFFPNANK
ncbi:MAG: tungsten ABC transporter substrate-binding protein [Ruminococcaceae bacterium]|nr:tungsten ABC transporter substrate-binding protein [Oscillospiraceae bacterium]